MSVFRAFESISIVSGYFELFASLCGQLGGNFI